MSARRAAPQITLLLDEMFSPIIADLLAAQGIDCQAVASRPLLRSRDDAEVLEGASAEGRVLVTNNAVDFEPLRRQWQAEARAAPGLIYTSDDRFPRDRDFVGRLTTALATVARSQEVANSGGVLWLRQPDA